MTIAKLLLEHNASAVTADEMQDTAARSAAERDQMKKQDSEKRKRTKSIVYCRSTKPISNKSLLELKNNEGETALLHAASLGCLAGVKFLMQQGAECVHKR